MALNFNKYAAEGNTFLKDYAKEMNMANDTDKAGRIFTAIMHALRDIIPMEESLQFISQLPMFVKAVYVNGWAVKKNKPKIKKMEDFLDLVRSHDYPAATNDFEYNNDVAERYVDTTFIYLRKYISLGEMEDLRDNLPKDLKSMIYLNMMF
ncbi:DUF2267 domain-containing protein [Maribacter aquivivus]|uniref:Uncharacterized conserved protein, DUF2267 family n=1 Tax=Maribacter aquivivus TaxID=228958 RepID=A0A1M6MTW9_9FLAO|nr:DUF2267 domain-containing protein [Maribacter aquivivus]SHJ86958.1 Uncharacterized conserved protein, DUF2267 family [Maribacter aquivivus]